MPHICSCCNESILELFPIYLIHTWHLTILYGPQGKGPYYPFPHLRVKLQRDPKDRSVSGKVPQITTFLTTTTSACHCMSSMSNMHSKRHVLKANVLLTVMHALDFIDLDAYWLHQICTVYSTEMVFLLLNMNENKTDSKIFSNNEDSKMYTLIWIIMSHWVYRA